MSKEPDGRAPLERLVRMRNFVRLKHHDAECFFVPGRYEITDNITAEDLGTGVDELTAWQDAANKLGYTA